MIVEWTERFRRAYRKLQGQEGERFDRALRLFAENPRHPSLGVKRIQGAADVREGRVGLKIRFTFDRIPDGIRLRNVDDHDACLRSP